MKDDKGYQCHRDSFDIEAQTALRIEFGHTLDALPPTCSMDMKIERFRNWQEH